MIEYISQIDFSQKYFFCHALFNSVVFMVIAISFFKKGKITYDIAKITIANLISQVLHLSSAFQTKDVDSKYFIPAVSVISLSTIIFVGTFLQLFYIANVRLGFTSTKDEHKFLITNGMFGLCRHPFYTSYILSYMAGFIYSPSIILWLQTCFMAIFYWNSMISEEEKYMESNMKDEYKVYKTKVGRLTPWF